MAIFWIFMEYWLVLIPENTNAYLGTPSREFINANTLTLSSSYLLSFHFFYPWPLRAINKCNKLWDTYIWLSNILFVEAFSVCSLLHYLKKAICFLHVALSVWHIISWRKEARSWARLWPAHPSTLRKWKMSPQYVDSQGCRRRRHGEQGGLFCGQRDRAAGMISMNTQNGIHLGRPGRPEWLEEANGPQAPGD